MITFIRTSDANGVKFPAALAWAHEVAAFVKSKTGLETKVEVPTSGNPYRIRWVTQGESLATHEQNMKKIASDPKYMELMAKAGDLFHARTTCDEIWMSA